MAIRSTSLTWTPVQEAFPQGLGYKITPADTPTLFQYGSLGPLMDGSCRRGTTTLAELKKVDGNDFAIGTFNHFKGGEMHMLGGVLYSISDPLDAKVVSDLHLCIPFALATQFHPTYQAHIDGVASYTALKALLNESWPIPAPCAVQISGCLDLYVQCVQEPGEPGQHFDQVPQKKAVLLNRTADLIGFRMGPDDYHFHVITNKMEGGHVIDTVVNSAEVLVSPVQSTNPINPLSAPPSSMV